MLTLLAVTSVQMSALSEFQSKPLHKRPHGPAIHCV